MTKYFKMRLTDKEDFIVPINHGFHNIVYIKTGGIEKSFYADVIRTDIDTNIIGMSIMTVKLCWDDDITPPDSVELLSRCIPGKDERSIIVHLYDSPDDSQEEKKKYYIFMPLPMTYDYFRYEKDHDYIIIRDQVDKKLKKVDAKLIAVTKYDSSYILEIEINPIHILTARNLLIFTTLEEDTARCKYVQIFDNLEEALEYENPKISNTKGPESKLSDYMNYMYYMNMVRPPSINDIWAPYVNKEQWNYEFKNYAKADIEATSKLYEDRKMIIKDIKRNGPATIIFWLNGEKTVVQCRPGDQDDIEKGVIMAIVKGYYTRYKNIKNWTKIFDIPYADEVDVEKVIGLGVLKDLFGEKDREWHYNHVLKWVYKIKGYKFEDEVAALKAHGYSDERIMKCLNTTKGKVREALGQDLVYKKEQKIPAVAKSNDKFIDHIKFPSGDEYKFTVNKEETKKVLKDIIQEDSLSEKVIKMFNNGIKIAKIAKSLGISEYFVKKALDEATKPKANPKKIDKILKKATKEKIVHKKHVMHTEIEFPNYLEKEECEKILEETKTKYAGKPKINCLSELQKYFDRECKHYKINQLYGNGYSMYEIGKIIGVNASAVQRMHNADSEE